MLKIKLISQGTLILILLLMATTVFSAELDSEKVTTTTPLKSQVSFKTTMTSSPDPILLATKAMEVGTRLDSVYCNEKMTYNIEKRKWFYNYENDQLQGVTKHYFGETFDTKFTRYEKWKFDEQANWTLYEEYNTPVTYAKEVVVINFTERVFANNLLVKRTDHRNSGGGSSISISGNDTIMNYHLSFDENEYFYRYNEAGLLECEFWEVQRTSPQDSSYNAIFYEYDNEGRVSYRSYYSSGTYHHLDQIKYVRTPSSDKVVVTSSYFRPALREGYNKDTLSSKWLEEEFLMVYDQDGKDSVYQYTHRLMPDKYVGEQKVLYTYNSVGQLIGESYFLRNPGLNDGEWYEQIHISYVYDANGNLEHYTKEYYDLQFNEWLIQEEFEYFYSTNLLTEDMLANNAVAVKVYPNPARSELCVEGLEAHSLISIYNQFGQKMKSIEMNQQTIDVSEFVPGIYFLDCETQNEKIIKKFIKH